MDMAALRQRLIAIQIDAAIKQLTWDDVLLGISTLTDEDKDKLVKALQDGSDSIRPLINSRLRAAIELVVAPQVDAFIQSGQVPIAIVAQIL